MSDVEPSVLRHAAFGLLVLALFLATYVMVADREGLPRRYYARYVVFLESKMRRMFLWSPGGPIVVGQLIGVFVFFALFVSVDFPLWYFFALLVVVAPSYWLERMRQRRLSALEEQVDGFVMALANALKSTPSVGDAFKSTQALMRDPIRQELELAAKEMRVGASLDQALLLMASRVGSRQLDSALSAVLIGRQVGGNLPKILDSTARSLREMARLEGVVRTKTAEGRMQMWVLALFPFVIMGALNAVSPGYFEPLTQSLVGYVLVVIASVCWIASLLLARKILRVDV